MGVSEFPDLYRFVAILEGVVSLRCFFQTSQFNVWRGHKFYG